MCVCTPHCAMCVNLRALEGTRLQWITMRIRVIMYYIVQCTLYNVHCTMYTVH